MKKFQAFTLCILTYYAMFVTAYVTYRLLMFNITDRDFLSTHMVIGVIHFFTAAVGISSMWRSEEDTDTDTNTDTTEE